MWMLLLMAGIIPDGSAYARIYVLPQTERIATWEPGDEAVQFFDLKGNKVGALAIDGELHRLCEALGTIFLTVRRESGQYDLMLTDKGLRAPRTRHNAALDNPNVINGLLYVTDMQRIDQERVSFPLLATQFDTIKMVYVGDSFFKLPSELAYQGRFPTRLWLLEFGGKKLAFMQGSFTIFQIDDEYLGRERVDSPNRATPFLTTYPLDIPGNSALRGKFRLDRVVPCDEAQALHVKWSQERELLYEVWQNAGAVILAYGSRASGTKVGYLDGLFKYHSLKTFPGIAIAGFRDRVWIVVRTKTKTVLSSHDLDLQ